MDLGSVSVDVDGNLDKLLATFREGRSETNRFDQTLDRTLKRTMRGVEQQSDRLAAAERELSQALRNGGRISADAARALGGYAGVKRRAERAAKSAAEAERRQTQEIRKQDETLDRLTRSYAPLRTAMQRYEADLRDIQNLQRSGRLTGNQAAFFNRQAARSLRDQQRQIRQAEQGIMNSSTAISSTLRNLAGIAATYFGVREIIRMSDAYTEFQNRLRVAGLEGERMAQVQEQLFQTAQRFGVELGTLGTLYSRAAQASEELGVSQEELLSFTENVAAAVRVQGGSVESAQGALLQLAQALQSGTVRAEEFNSINEGLLPILQAVARGSDEFGGSVARLRAAVLKGEVSSREFFEAFQNGADVLQNQAASANLTIAQSFTILRNALVNFIGQSEQAGTAAQVMAEAIRLLADNVDTIIPAIAVLSVALGIGFVANAVRARAAVAGVTLSLNGMAIAARGAGSALLTAFGGPVGLAITGVTLALGALAIEANRTDRLIEEVDQSAQNLKDSMEALGVETGAAGDETAQVGSASQTTGGLFTRFQGVIQRTTQRYLELAGAARRARIEMLQTELTQGTRRLTELQRRSPENRDQIDRDAWRALGRGDFATALDPTTAFARLRNVWTGGRSDREITGAIGEQEALNETIRAQLDAIRDDVFANPNPDAPSVDIGTDDGDEGGGSTSQNRFDATEFARDFMMRRRALEDQQLAAEISVTHDAERRAELEHRQVQRRFDALQDEIAWQDRQDRAALQEVLASEDATAAQKAAAVVQLAQLDRRREQLENINEAIAIEERERIDLRERERIRSEALEGAVQQIGIEREMLELQSDLADSARARRRLELQILELQEREQRARLEAVIASETAAEAEKQRARNILASLDESFALQREQTVRGNLSPAEKFLDGLVMTAGEAREALEAVQVDGLGHIEEGLFDILSGTESVTEAFHQMAQSIINDLLRIAIQQSIIRPLAESLFGGGGGGGFLDFLGPLFGHSAGALKTVGVGHQGMTAGRPSSFRTVPVGVFANAPRFHDGLFRPDEFPAILQTGEQVLPRGMSAGSQFTFGDIIVPGARSEREGRKTAKQVAAEIQRQITGASRTGVT